MARGGQAELEVLLQLHLHRLSAGVAVRRRVGDRDLELRLAGRVQRLELLSLRLDQQLERAGADGLANQSRGCLDALAGRGQVAGIGERQVELSPKEFDLLRLFASNPGRVFPRKYLLEKIWDYSYEGYDRTIDSHINRLRAKIEENPENPQMVLTVWGIGYKFSDEQ